MSQFPYSAITRLRPYPHGPVSPDPAPNIPRSRNKSRRPYPDTKVTEVRRLVEETTLTYSEIEKKTGVSAGLACLWKRNHGWQRPPFAPRSTDNVPRERASARLRRRWLGHRISALAERAVRELEASATVDLDKLAEALELLKLAKLAAGRRKRGEMRAAEESRDGPRLFDAQPREVMRAFRAAGIRTENLTEEALVDFIISRAPPPPRNLTKRERLHKRMMERE
jgi:hypothetical protein